MKSKDKLINISLILSVVAIAIIGFSYAFFSLNISGVGSLIDGTTVLFEITMGDDTPIELSTAYPGDHSYKEFTVENTGTKNAAYGLNWDIETNTYLYNELVYSYTCKSYKYYGTASEVEYGTCEDKTNTPVPINDDLIVDDVVIQKDITHVYSLDVMFMEMSSLQNYNLNAFFSGTVVPFDAGEVEEVIVTPWYESCTSESTDIKCKIISDTSTNSIPFADNVASTYVSSSSGINYGAPSSDTNGNGLYYTTDTTKTEDTDDDGNGERVYFYRGSVSNNFVLFGGFCWKIIRTVEDGSVRLRYGGEPIISEGVNTCKPNNSLVFVGTGQVNYSNGSNDNAYLGYMQGTLNATSYEGTHTNSTNSPIKTVVDNWYAANLTSYSNYIANTIYCNDRSLGTDGTVAGLTFVAANAYGTNNAIYAITRRLATGGESGDISAYSAVNASPSYKCAQQNDQFTLSTEAGGIDNYGNNKLTYPIALLTGDEVSFAGGAHSITTGTSWFLSLNTSQYWMMSPFRQGSGGSEVSRNIMIKTSGQMNVGQPKSVGYAVPVISLKGDVNVSSGTGTNLNPYVIQTN